MLSPPLRRDCPLASLEALYEEEYAYGSRSDIRHGRYLILTCVCLTTIGAYDTLDGLESRIRRRENVSTEK